MDDHLSGDLGSRAVRIDGDAVTHMEDKPLAYGTTDPNGVQVVLTDEVWREKIVRDHPEIAEHRSDVLQTVSAPDHFAVDPIFERRKRYDARGVGPSRWLLSS